MAWKNKFNKIAPGLTNNEIVVLVVFKIFFTWKYIKIIFLFIFLNLFLTLTH
jgi:mannose/fructose/N-acetylgalactosamine-specific phosphotransferase system component IID